MLTEPNIHDFTELSIQNFKAFGKRQHIPLKPITLLFGANSSGKSSILHALALLHHLAKTGDCNPSLTKLGGDSIDLGGFGQFVYTKNTELQVEFAFPLNIATLHYALEGPLFPDNESAAIIFDCMKETTVTVRIELPQGSADQRSADHKELEPVASFTVHEGEHMVFRQGYDQRWHGAGAFGSFDIRSAENPMYIEFMKALEKQGFFKYTPPPSKLMEPSLPLAVDLDPDVVNSILNAVSSPSSYELLWQLYSQDYQENHSPEQGIRAFACLKAIAPKISKSCKAWAESWRIENPSQYFAWIRTLDTYFSDDVLSTGAISKSEIDERRRAVEAAFRIAGDEELWASFRPLDIRKQLARRVNSIFYLGPLRAYPGRAITEGLVDDPDWKASGSFAWEGLLKNGELRERVNTWLGSDFLKTGYRLEARKLYALEDLDLILSTMNSRPDLTIAQMLEGTVPTSKELRLTDLGSGTQVSHRDIGIGISQVLPVLAHAYGSRRSLIAIEQPEIHLHPALQAELGDVFIESALGKSGNGNRFVLETHSEHLILRLLRRIRETTEGELEDERFALRPEDIAVLYVKPGPEGAEVVELRVTEQGEFADKWPDGFFPERARELF